MSHRTLQRITFDRHAKEQPRCEVRDALKGGYCEKPGTQRTIDGLLCEQHARAFFITTAKEAGNRSVRRRLLCLDS